MHLRCGASGIVLAVIIGLILLIVGFVFIFANQKPTESDVQVVQRQLKGFALLILAPIVATAIVMIFQI